MVSFLKVTPELVKHKGVFFIILGSIGAGKSTFVSQIPRSLYLYHSDDDGVIELAARKLIPETTRIWPKPFTTTESLYKQMEEATQACLDLKLHTIIVEGLTGIMTVWTKTAIATHYDGKQGLFDSYGAGTRTLKDKEMFLPKIMALTEATRKAGVNLVYTGHTGDKSSSDSKTGESITKRIPAFPPALLDRFGGSANLVGILCEKPKLVKTSGKAIIREGEQGTSRYLAMSADAYVIAKNRYGQRNPIYLDGTPKENWDAFVNTLNIDPVTLRG
jgi:hypothetical protein